jgi:hypothetical protein
MMSEVIKRNGPRIEVPLGHSVVEKNRNWQAMIFAQSIQQAAAISGRHLSIEPQGLIG